MTVVNALNKAIIEKMVAELDGAPVPVSLWGRDHYSTLGYLECRAVDNGGRIEPLHMRGRPGAPAIDYPTRLAQGVLLQNHSDYDCLSDIEVAGLIEDHGTGMNPLVRMTEKGMLVCAALRAHKAAGGNFSNFTFQS